MVGSLEGRINNHRNLDIAEKENPMLGSLADTAAFYRLEAKVLELDNKVNGIESTLSVKFYKF